MAGHNDAHIRLHYETLGLVPGAGLRDVKKRARQMFLRFHPDLNPHNRDFCEEKTKGIAAAYTALLAALRAAPGSEPEAQDPAASEALVIELSHRLFALSTAHVRGVLRLKDVRLDDVSMVGGAFPYVSGAFYHNDELVMLWNLHAQLGLRDPPVGSDIGRSKLVHADCGGAPVGFLADDVPGVAAAHDPAPGDAGEYGAYVTGVLDTPHGPAALLSLRALLYGRDDNF
jgi:chemotaxis signal transduction protein